jgi:hypothetical protein
MRSASITPVQAAIASIAISALFVVVAFLMVRRARSQCTKPRDPLEARILPMLRSPSLREKLLFGLAVLVAASAPWATYLLEE